MKKLEEEARIFAVEAHQGQIKKSEPDKPKAVHLIGTGKILEEYGYSPEIVASGYLHEIIEDTKYSFEDLEKIFGFEVASLVLGASELDKSFPWKVRKQHFIEKIRNLSFRNKPVICADKIDSLESFIWTFAKNGTYDFSSFSECYDLQKWYYSEVYHSLIFQEDADLPIFRRFKEDIQVFFEKKEDIFVRDSIFETEQNLYQKLKKFQAYKEELCHLKKLCNSVKTFVIEFSGTPRSGKTEILKKFEEFFQKGGFQVSFLEEFSTSKYCREVIRTSFKPSSYELMVRIQEEIEKQLLSFRQENPDILLIDRGINDRYIWDVKNFQSGNYGKEKFLTLLECVKRNKGLVDCFVLLYTDALTSLKRDYHNSLCLEPRKFQSLENIESYNAGLLSSIEFLRENVKDFYNLNTSILSKQEVTLEIMDHIMPLMRTRYLDTFKKNYGVK